MRRHFCAPLPSIHVDYLRTIDGQHPIGIDSNTEQARVGLGEEEGGREGGREGGEKEGGQEGGWEGGRRERNETMCLLQTC